MTSVLLTRGFELLTEGLRPFVQEKLSPTQLRDLHSRHGTAPDAQSLLVSMWSHWNDCFRHDLSFAERSLVSELREFRNRWAHQDSFTLRESYRAIENIQMLLHAVGATQAEAAELLRKRTLQRLADQEVRDGKVTVQRDVFTLVITIVCFTAVLCGLGVAAMIVTPAVRESRAVWLGVGLVIFAFSRAIWKQLFPAQVSSVGPRECPNCSRIIYSPDCPYCAGHHDSTPDLFNPKTAVGSKNAG